MKVEKARSNKFHRKEKVDYIGREDYSFDMSDECVNEGEINVVELTPGPPYKCKFLKSSNGKNLVELVKNDNFVTKTYTFNIAKCDEIFD